VDGRSSIEAGLGVDQEPVDRGTAPVRSRTDPAVLAGRCTQQGHSRVDPPAPQDAPVSAHRGLVLARDLALARDPAWVVQLASRRPQGKLPDRRERLRSSAADASSIPRPKKAR
jgi:hypothetical protein